MYSSLVILEKVEAYYYQSKYSNKKTNSKWHQKHNTFNKQIHYTATKSQ